MGVRDERGPGRDLGSDLNPGPRVYMMPRHPLDDIFFLTHFGFLSTPKKLKTENRVTVLPHNNCN